MTKQTPIQLLEDRIKQLEKLTQFHDTSYKQVIGLHYDIGLLKSKTNATNQSVNELKNTCADFADDTHKYLDRLGAFKKQKEKSSDCTGFDSILGQTKTLFIFVCGFGVGLLLGMIAVAGVLK